MTDSPPIAAPDAPAPLFALRGAVVEFGLPAARRRVLDGTDFALLPGQRAVILGPSGAGKSVLLGALLGFVPLTAGEVVRPDPLFARCAVLFQQDALLEDLTIEANLALALRHGRGIEAGLLDPDAGTRAAIAATLTELGLDAERVLPLRPAALSGGMRRRVALARALLREPEVLLADEPTSGLDPQSAAQVFALLNQMARARHLTLLLITHDPQQAALIGDPVYAFGTGGQLIRWQPAADLDPTSSAVALQAWLPTVLVGGGVQSSPPAFDPIPAISLEPALARVGRGAELLAQAAHRPAALTFTRELLLWGFGTLPLLGLLFLMLGVVMEVQAEDAVVEYGLSNRLPELAALGLLRIAPLLTGFLLAGRCGAAITARLGGMELGGQLRALRTLDLDPARELWPPLAWALTLAAPLLMLAGLLCGLLGATAALLAPFSRARITAEYFLSALPAFITPGELALAISKSLLMGAGIAVLAWRGGTCPMRAPEEVTRAMTRGLVAGFLWCGAVDSVLSLLLT